MSPAGKATVGTASRSRPGIDPLKPATRRGPSLLASTLALSTLALGASRANAQDVESVWTDDARAEHERATAVYGLWVRARHDLSKPTSQRECYDGVATRTGALLRMLEARAERGRIPEWSVHDMATQLDELEEYATEICTRTRVSDGDSELDLWQDPFRQRMPRDRAILRLGARFEVTPRMRAGGYGQISGYALRGALGGFVLPWLRVEATAALSWLPLYGPHGSIGARALITAPWSLLRIAGGLAVSVIGAADRFGRNEFGWLGLQIEVPLEVSFELNESVGLTLTGGPVFTQAGAVRPDARAIGGSLGLLVEVVL